ncbi:MAG: 2-hydroxyacyl-CoA dehydratase [Deltaproteobacteria bacterium]|nr:2-hydroxyacyl-CoA dehydratase [Deltaproteobacteria bacterium]
MPLDWKAIGSSFDRQEYRAEQRKKHGRKTVCVLPGDYPGELLTALDLLAMEHWGAALALRPVDALRCLPSYVCSVVQHVLQWSLDGGAEGVEGVIVPSTCDSLKGLGSILAELTSPLPCRVIPFDSAQACRTTGGAAGPRHDGLQPVLDPFRRAELDQLIKACEELAGRRLETWRLEQALRAHAEAEQLGRELYRRRASLVLGERRTIELLRAREYLHVEDLLDVLSQALAHVESAAHPPAAAPASRVPILLSGLVPEPMELLDRIEEAGLRVAADDLLCLGRRWRPPLLQIGAAGVAVSPLRTSEPGEATPAPAPAPGAGSHRPTARVLVSPIPFSAAEISANPLEKLLQRMAALPPAPTRSSSRPSRSSWLLSEVHRSGARGVVALVVKFCEPELFELPLLRNALDEARVPLLVLEHELGVAPGGSVDTRLEAFGEILR